MQTLRRLAILAALAAPFMSMTAPAVADEPFDVLRSYYAVDAHLPLDIETLGTSEQAGQQRTDFTFATFDNEIVRARLEFPDLVRFPGQRPVVILLHGITQSLDQWWREDRGPYSFPSAHREALVENGYAVLAIDLRNHGARLQAHNFETPVRYLEEGYLEAARKMISQSAIDVRRAIDTVATFDALDPERVSVVGYSLGAWSGFIAAAVDERVTSAVLIGLPFLPPANGDRTHFISQFEYTAGFDGRPVHFIAGTEDTFLPRDAIDALMAQMGSGASATWVESGHDYPHATAALTLQHLTR